MNWNIIGESWFAGQSINALYDNVIDTAQISSGRFRALRERIQCKLIWTLDLRLSVQY